MRVISWMLLARLWLASPGSCVVIVTHDPAVAAEADITVKMQDGRLAE